MEVAQFASSSVCGSAVSYVSDNIGSTVDCIGCHGNIQTNIRYCVAATIGEKNISRFWANLNFGVFIVALVFEWVAIAYEYNTIEWKNNCIMRLCASEP